MILAHFVYMQNFLGYGNINDVFWTLCYEVQFYVVFVGVLVLARLIKNELSEWHSHIFLIIIGLIAFMLSVATFFGPIKVPINGLFIDRWYQFFIGVLAMQSCRDRSFKLGFILASMPILLGSLLYPETGMDNGLTALFIAWLLVVVARRERMSKWLSGKIPQFMGHLSYSLYLIHPVVGWRFIKLLRELYGDDFSPIQAWFVLGAGIGVSIVSAWIMYKLIEVPSLKICHQIKMDRPLTFGRLLESMQILRKNA